MSGADSPYPVVTVDTSGADLGDLPGASLLKGDGSRTLRVTLKAVTIEAVVEDGILIHANSPVYQKGGERDVYMFGPTLRLKAGDSYTVLLTNDEGFTR